VGYDLHITRADHYPDHAMYPISLREWVAVADQEPRMTKCQQDGKHLVYTYTNADGRSWSLGWRSGLITIWKGYDASAELAVVAHKLSARLVGDEDEEYHADGSFTPWSGPRPILLDRPLNVDEAAAAWETIFDRQGDDFHSWRPGPDHARHAFGAFRVFAAREIAAADVLEADGLLYQFSPFGSEGEPAFRLSLVRQLATGTDGGLAQVECHLDYAMTGDLASLGSFHDWWFPEHGVASDEWFDSLVGRPEWRLLNDLAPLAFGFDTAEAC
jgi:hypothetical protein